MIQYEVLKDLVEMFVLQTPARLNLIEAGIKKKNHDQVKRAAHILRASCSYLGISEMAQLSAKLEDMATRNDAWNDQNALACLYALEESYDESILELEKYTRAVMHE